jgi:hypothetical protein
MWYYEYIVIKKGGTNNAFTGRCGRWDRCGLENYLIRLLLRVITHKRCYAGIGYPIALEAGLTVSDQCTLQVRVRMLVIPLAISSVSPCLLIGVSP